jgi:3-aminobutyryl-CoA ammonia-lyase
MSQADAHYAGNLVAGGRLMELFGDVATELLIHSDGDEGLFRAYENVEFLAPVFAGDFLEAEGEICKVGNTSRKMSFEIRKVIEADRTPGSTKAFVLDTPVVVAKAVGTCVVPSAKSKAANC